MPLIARARVPARIWRLNAVTAFGGDDDPVGGAGRGMDRGTRGSEGASLYRQWVSTKESRNASIKSYGAIQTLSM